MNSNIENGDVAFARDSGDRIDASLSISCVDFMAIYSYVKVIDSALCQDKYKREDIRYLTHQSRKSVPPGHGRSADRPAKSYYSGFSGLGIAPGLLDIIDRLGFSEPTPIQRQSIPISIEGKDLIAIAQTGTGKTLAFAIPMIQRLAQIKGRGLIITPTRELAIQIDEALNDVGLILGLRTAVLIGGAPMAPQRRSLERNPRVIVATPGRLLDHLEHQIVSLNDVQILVLDEADRMLDMGFAPQINRILAAVPKKRQMMLFSATMPKEILALARREMQVPIHVEVAPSGTAPAKVVQELFFVEKGAKTRLLKVLLGQYLGPVLIFTRTKHGARKLTREVKSMGHSAAEIHSNRTLPQRREALDGFKSGKYRALVATDIASRGIDVSGIELVVNYDLPSNSEDYVHRIGRTARAGLSGRAISFATLDQKKDIRDIERLIRTDIPIMKLPPLPLQRRGEFAPKPSRAEEPPQRPIPNHRPSKKPISSRRSSGRVGFRWRKRR
jgi:ATP-dependent RNA helicase RhlE